MNADGSIICSTCEGTMRQEDPFCPHCGKLSPGLVSPGDFALEMQDVPSERLREHLVQVLKGLFPAMDSVAASQRLKWDSRILVEGIDEASAERLREALASLKVPARPIRAPGDLPWLKRLLNPGLGISAVSLLFAGLLGGLAVLVLVLLAAAAPAAWAVLLSHSREALIPIGEIRPHDAERWIGVARDFSSVIGQLAREDAEKLTTIAAAVFEVQRRLKRDSLLATVSGEDQGDLFHKLTEALRVGVDLGRRLNASRGDEQIAQRIELESLSETVGKTLEWFRSLETQDLKPAGQLGAELNQVAENIERILRDVRPNSAHVPRRSDKTLA
jgi:hypothetical protein